jgi:hypothetical protein
MRGVFECGNDSLRRSDSALGQIRCLGENVSRAGRLVKFPCRCFVLVENSGLDSKRWISSCDGSLSATISSGQAQSSIVSRCEQSNIVRVEDYLARNGRSDEGRALGISFVFLLLRLTVFLL